MDGKNVADFIDPDIAEKLEALEREEEKLEAEGFYDSDEEIVRSFVRSFFLEVSDFLQNLQVDSDEELYAADEASAKAAKLASERKKMFKNRPVMPRTAGMRTIGEMTKKLSAAGYDTSRIEAHAMVAKASNAALRKRKREERDEAMDVDGEEVGEWADESMEVDGEDASPKRAKGNSGAVVAKSKLPQSNRQLAGFKNAEVRDINPLLIMFNVLLHRLRPLSKQTRLSNCAILANVNEICWPELGNPIVLSKPRWSVYYHFWCGKIS